MKNYLLALALAVVGALAAQYLLRGSVYSLILWAIFGLLLGYWSTRSRRQLAGAGAVYGFVLSYLFLIIAYNGPTPRSSHLGGFAALSLFGAGCGAILALIGRQFKRGGKA